ncbi:reverse transcriptase domain, reverse transcriptase zinc-binding domain protein [Tanacetum coccineum]
MYRAGLNISSKVSDVFRDGILNWPAELAAKYPILNSIQAPNVAPNTPDKLEWRSNLGVAAVFAVSTVWLAIRTRDVKVMWADVVWFSNCIHRHAFNLWLIMKRRLKTQDSLSSWDLASPIAALNCSLCDSQPDSHDHLFFECSFSKQVWKHMMDLAGVSPVIYNIYAAISSILPIAKRRTWDSVIIKLVIASTAYFLWQERNLRLFKNNKRSVAQVIECITSSIRLKLLSCRFKKSKRGLVLMRHWKIPEILLDLK